MRNVQSVAGSAVWTPDDKAIFFPFAMGNRLTLQRLNADGSGRPIRVMEGSRPLSSSSHRSRAPDAPT
jgi:hypothetical protein